MPIRRLAILIALVSLAGCLRPRPSPTPVRADALSVAVYRAVAESIYVPTTGQRIAIATTSVDTTCRVASCAPLVARWGFERAWWDDADSADASVAIAELIARSGRTVDLRAVSAGRPLLTPANRDASPAPHAAEREWIAFRDAHEGAAGVLLFSPVGFTRSRRNAVLFVDWRCGPTCGHALAATLGAVNDSTWRITNMLLLPDGVR